MSGSFFQKTNSEPLTDVSSHSSIRNSHSTSRSSFQKHFQSMNPSPSFFSGASPKFGKIPRNSSVGAPFSTMNSLHESCENDRDSSRSGIYVKNRPRVASKGVRASGLTCRLQVNKELSSVDKINDPAAQRIVVAGKMHLGVYHFREDDCSLRLVHDFVNTNGSLHGKKPSQLKRSAAHKISTISDVKTGFSDRKNFIAICGTSTSISIYDINKMQTAESPIYSILSEHARSINSIDFNMTQNNLLVSSGQDGFIKVWDLRSQQSKKNKSDLSINTGSDAVRDVKWMPSYDFSSFEESADVSNRSHKLASIHDSGLLLTFDIRQPSQTEWKINAHSGPGLCLNWHPNLDFIMTGGRDGKCCGWNVGDRSFNMMSNMNQGSILTPGFSISSAATSTIFPDIVINTGHPLTKLKIRPKAEKDPFNSLVATSSLGEDSDVSVYALSREFIPKHVLLTSAPSCGFVWWNSNTIFDIDRQNAITGWQLDKEPTLLENLPKNVVKWRDIEGDGLLFLGQTKGHYESAFHEEVTPSYVTKSPQARLNSSTMGSIFGNGLGKSHGSSSNLFSAHNTVDSERFPSIRGVTGSFSKKANGQTVGPGSHHNSVVSANFSTRSEVPPLEVRKSPVLVSLDLPQVLNSIRTSNLRINKINSKFEEVAILRESPVEVFKFLARELKFSYMQERTRSDTKAGADTNASMSEKEFKSVLMDKIGFTEHNTWSKFMRSESHSVSANLESQIETESVGESCHDPVIEDTASSSPKVTMPSTKADWEELDVRKKLDHLIELISMCDHNAGTYAYVEDMMNYKVWVLIRDSLVWNLKQLAKVGAGGEIEDSRVLRHGDGTIVRKDGKRQDSMTSEYSSFSVSELGSSLDTATPPKMISSLLSGRSSNRESSSNLKGMLRGDAKEVGHSTGAAETHQVDRVSKVSNGSNPKLAELRREKSLRLSEDESAIDDDDDGSAQAPTLESYNPPQGSAVGERKSSYASETQRRISFIDNFLTNMRSPKRHSEACSSDNKLNSVSSKRSSQLSHGFSPSGKGSLDLSSKTGRRSSRENFSPLLESPTDFEGLAAAGATLNTNNLKHTSQIAAMFKNASRKMPQKMDVPWSAATVIQQIYRQSVEAGNILLTVSILMLFQTTFHITSATVVKETLAEFISILHRYELFEITADLIKYSPWEDISGLAGGQSSVRLYCERCKKLIVNERSKERFTEEWQKTGNKTVMHKFGYWYCDNCRKPSTLCVVCERPVKKMTICSLNCGHLGHFSCFQDWFIKENLNVCPCGCEGELFRRTQD
ncbi:LAMI_0G06722g1_1 [Lachancea mirantina]|uniref:Restriction of telomere capping protein 1 n=1 Tax=Lachancea mirantina TaxID=1230905 RepID=A0A1G4K9C8_9SACH|nr:LAMI_0G06722g1_1 [Lachancea mirantina]